MLLSYNYSSISHFESEIQKSSAVKQIPITEVN